MKFSNEYSVVLTIQSEKDLTRLKIMGHNHDVSLVDSYLRSRITGLVSVVESAVEYQYEEARPMLRDVIRERDPN